MAGKLLSSKWDGLSPVLFASLYEVGFDGYAINEDPDVVSAPYTEGQIESKANWNSVYENEGAEKSIPFLASGAQSGVLLDLLNVVKGTTLGKFLESNNIAAPIDGAGRVLSSLEGRHGMTKINSRQIYSGATPVNIPLTLKFRAFENAAEEVERPIDQLFQWSLAKEIAAGSFFSNAIGSNKSILERLLPSKIPAMLWLTLGSGGGARSFSPMVIESIGHPLKVPRSKDGEMLNVEVQLSLSTLTAMDVMDWKNTRGNNTRPIQLKASQR